MRALKRAASAAVRNGGADPSASSSLEEVHVEEERNENGSRVRDALNDLQTRLEAAVDEIRPKLRRAFDELDARVDEAVADIRPRARAALGDVQPRVDQFVADVQPRLDSLLQRVQARIDELRHDLDERAARSASREARGPAGELTSGDDADRPDDEDAAGA